ncbi:MAG: OmpA family protein [Bacteroidales bacterium]|nr:OmpA family protein [Bacteroidales bacterium]
MLTTIFVFLFFVSFAQKDECPKTKNKKALELYDQALDVLRDNDMAAIKLLKEAVKIAPKYVEAYYVLGDIYYNLPEKVRQKVMKTGNTSELSNIDSYMTQANRYFNMVIGLCPSYANYSSYFFIGEFYYGRNMYDKASELYQVFLDNTTEKGSLLERARKKNKQCKTYKELLQNPVPFNPKAVEGVSSKEDEYLPLISPDGDFIFYTRGYYKKGTNSYINSAFVEEFTVSEKLPKSEPGINKYNDGNPMSSPFNQAQDVVKQGAVSITIDNRFLYVTICKTERDYTNCDIYVSENIDGKWSALKNLGPNINSNESWESQPSISADGKTLFFASVRPDNIDFNMSNQSSDIWKSVQDEKGNWKKAENLGPTINTAGDEKSPFMHSDSQTLYFSSNGRTGVGDYDIYYSRVNNGRWTEPVNIGFPINSENEDLGFVVSTDGKTGYFTSNRLSGPGKRDIFSFDLYQEARPEKVFFAKGQLVDDKGADLQDAKIEIKNTKTSKVTEGMVDKKTGNYAIAVATEDDAELLMTVKKKDYTFTSKLIKPTEELVQEPVKIDFEVKPVAVGKTVELNDIYFATASALFDNSSIKILESFIEFLEENPTVKIEIRGHTDNEGNAETNMELSIKRAKAVHDFLILMGVEKHRLSYKGFGQTKPVASNDTPEGRSKNRRTEFLIIAK